VLDGSLILFLFDACFFGVFFCFFPQYFAADGFTYGSTTRNWPRLQQLAQETNTLFVPSVGPGYMDVSVRPWNGITTRDRKNGEYYDRMWQAALKSSSSQANQVVSVTSFNEWHEGTQIEPAVVAKRGGGARASSTPYKDYGSLGPAGYLKRTAKWSELVWRERRP
jgi:glycoprotein endo-alpha-1,2-mannosidase